LGSLDTLLSAMAAAMVRQLKMRFFEANLLCKANLWSA
jgi:hypothetical protein